MASQSAAAPAVVKTIPGSVLVFMPTGRQGHEVCAALQGSGKHVYGATHVHHSLALEAFGIKLTPHHLHSAALEAMGVTPVPFDFNSPALTAKVIAGMELVWFATDYEHAAGHHADLEYLQGKRIVDDCVAAGVKHVVFSSVWKADEAGETVAPFHSKWRIEQHLKAVAAESGMGFTILRPAGFMENFDDAEHWNHLVPGVVKGLSMALASSPLVACRDIGLASAAVLRNPAAYAGKTIDLVSCWKTGLEIADALTAASGVPSVYQTVMPEFIMALTMPQMFHMCQFMEAGDHTLDATTFIALVPAPLSLEDFFKMQLAKYQLAKEKHAK